MLAHQTSWKRKELDGLADDATLHSPSTGIPQSAFAEPGIQAEGAGWSLGLPLQGCMYLPPVTTQWEPSILLSGVGTGPGTGEVHDHMYGEEAEQMGMVQLLHAVWPIMSALFLAGFVYIVVFPFFTYVPSSGLMGDNLPKVGFAASSHLGCRQ